MSQTGEMDVSLCERAQKTQGKPGKPENPENRGQERVKKSVSFVSD